MINDLIEKALSIKDYIKGMELLEQMNYVSMLYNEMSSIPLEQIEDPHSFYKAKSHLETIRMYVQAGYKDKKVKELEKRVQEMPFCKIIKKSEKDNPLLEVTISEDFYAWISYIWGPTIHVKFFQKNTDEYGDAYSVCVILRWKAIPEWLKQEMKFVYGHLEKDVSIYNWVDIILDIAKELKEKAKELVALCKSSSNVDNTGVTKTRHKSWKTKGRIISLTKKMPLARLVHAKKEQQEAWNNSPSFHGSNGTYVENVNPFWCLNIKIKRPSYEVPQPIEIPKDVHDYITQSLMPRLGWGRITQERLNRINTVLSGIETELVTFDTDKAALYREFLPISFNSWNDFLNDKLKDIQ